GFFFSSRRRHTSSTRDWSSDVCSSDLIGVPQTARQIELEPPRRAGRQRRDDDLVEILFSKRITHRPQRTRVADLATDVESGVARSEEHTSELQSRVDLVCRLLLEKKKT